MAATPVQAATGNAVGKIITLTPGVFVQRDGARLPLALNSPVQDTDTIITDASGRARILFDDDGAVALGPDTSLSLREVLPEGKAPTFKAHVARGLARFITGKIVEANPRGFAVSTPEGVAGIRGTIFALQVGNGQTTLYVVNASRDVVLNNVSVPGGFKMTLPGGSPLPMTPADMALTQTVAVAPSSESAVPEQALAASLDTGDPLTPTALADLGLGIQNTGDTLQAPSTQFSGHVSGALTTTKLTAAYAWSGSFGFDVDLGSGAISGATMSLSGTLGQDGDGGGLLPIDSGISLAGGSGSVSGNTFSINGFTGSGLDAHPTYPGDDSVYRGMVSLAGFGWNGASMNGAIQQSGNGVTVSGTYEVLWSGYNPATIPEVSADRGTFTGSN
jgi:hypothetical protein